MDNKVLDDSRLLSIMEHVLDELLGGICITDGKGIILRAGKSCENLYGIKGENYEGQHVCVLEEEGRFSPSATMLALRERKKVTLTQPDKYGHQLLVTAAPIFEPETKEIIYVISYASWDISNVLELQRHYDKLQREMTRSSLELSSLKKKLLSVDIIAESPKMKQVKHLVEKTAPTDVPILITGDIGTGKSNMAKYIHRISQRKDGPFGQISCSVFSGNILEDELFGYVNVNPRTGEETEKIGLCEILDSGTLFLEDIEYMNKETQGILLYLLKNKCYYKRNSKIAKNADIRIIASSRKNTTDLSKELREGLFYRLSSVAINIPSLKERKEDISLLTAVFFKELNEIHKKEMKISIQACDMLKAYSWPGNVTELKYMIQQIFLTKDEALVQPHHLPDYVSPYAAAGFSAKIDLKEYLEYYEGRLVLQAYEKCGTTVKLAKYLGISQASAVRKLQKYLNREDI